MGNEYGVTGRVRRGYGCVSVDDRPDYIPVMADVRSR